MDEIIRILTEFGVPFAYDHFVEGEGPNPPFVCYLFPSTENFSADGIVYQGIDVTDIELYTDKKNPDLEKKLERLLTRAGIFYEREEAWIEEEKLYEVVYEFTVPADDGTDAAKAGEVRDASGQEE